LSKPGAKVHTEILERQPSTCSAASCRLYKNGFTKSQNRADVFLERDLERGRLAMRAKCFFRERAQLVDAGCRVGKHWMLINSIG
jgi:hypothetical protein